MENANRDGPDPSALVTVAVFRQPWQAHLAKANLEAENIVAFVMGEHEDWGRQLSGPAGQCRLQVSAVDAEEALAILREPAENDASQPVEHAESIACPQCGDRNVSEDSTKTLGRSFGDFFRRYYLGKNPRHFRCGACGRTWMER